eukprot:gene13413-13400_t
MLGVFWFDSAVYGAFFPGLAAVGYSPNLSHHAPRVAVCVCASLALPTPPLRRRRRRYNAAALGGLERSLYGFTWNAAVGCATASDAVQFGD